MSRTYLEWLSNLACCPLRKKRDFILPRFILMTDDERLPDPTSIVGLLPPNSAIIARSQDMARVKVLINVLRPICSSHNIALLAAGDFKTVRSFDVDGIHLSETAVLETNTEMVSFPERWILTAAAHSVSAVQRANSLRADVVMISPVFATRSHPDTQVLGPSGYRHLAQHAPESACPLGGITRDTIKQLKGAPIAAIAGIDLFLDDASAT